LRPLDVRLALRSAVALFGVGAVLLGVACLVEDPSDLPVLAGLAVLALAVCLALLGLERANRGSLGLAFAADVLAVGMIATAVAVTREAHSPYAGYYVFVALHAAAFQPRGRVLAMIGITTAAFLAPLAYDSDNARWFATIAVATGLPALVLVWLTHLGVTSMARERRTLAAREAEAMRIAESDGLTGIGNYRRFWRALQSEAARSRRHDQPFSLIVLDLDGFKQINDELGHQAGDEALRRVAEALQGQLRTEDVLCRQGGDEFAVIAVAAPSSEASELSRRLVDAVDRAGARGLSHPLSASAGWATFGDPETTAEGLLAQADQALRDAKTDKPGSDRTSARPAPRTPGRRRPTDRRLAALASCSRALALAPDEQAVVQIAVVHMADALSADAVELWRPGAQGGPPELVARGHHAGTSAPSAADSPPLSELESVMAANHVAWLRGGGMLLPVSYEGNVQGVIVVHTGSNRGPGLHERRLALAMATQVGRALTAAAVRSTLDGGPDDLDALAEAAGAGPQAARVAGLAVAISRELGADEGEVETIRRAALLHKVGMLGVPAGLPLRPTPLTEDEIDVLREHPIIAHRLLGSIPRFGNAARVLRHAHERYDGTGYPDGLTGAEIPPPSRVLHVAIAYCAMREPRPWRASLSDSEARAELRRAAGTQLDPEVVNVALRVLDSPGVAEVS
jgi:diguanylate cyclase (GGDEF)-like protein